jgi:hypothetical protein
MNEPARSPADPVRRRAGARLPVLTLAALAAVLPALACDRSSPPASGEGAPASFEQIPNQPGALASMRTERVVGFTGPGGAPFEVDVRGADGSNQLERRIGRRTFALPLRTDGLARTQYPCASCHQGAVTARRDPDVHQNVRPVHPPGVASCLACHRASSVDRLTLNTGETVSFDHAYRLCAQCHFQQVDAWAQGHHGKRLDGWQGRRVVMGCADCHDPHRPQPSPRTPFAGPRLPQTGTLLPGGGTVDDDLGERFPLPPGVVPPTQKARP